MKKLVFLFLSLLTAGSLFQACDNSKTYAEMLEDEKNAVNKFIKDNDIRVISLEEFERDTITASKEAGNGYDEYVAFSNGVYMQIVDRGGKEDKNGVEVINEVDTFANNNVICTRYVEQDMMTGDTTCFNVPLERWMDVPDYYKFPLTFRYVHYYANKVRQSAIRMELQFHNLYYSIINRNPNYRIKRFHKQ